MTDTDAIRNLVASYCLEADGGRHAQWAALFADDGILTIAGSLAGRGPAELERWITGRNLPNGYHMVSNLRIEAEEHTARADMNFATVLANQTIGVIGLYSARVDRTAAGWRISEWRIEPHAPRGTA